MVGITVSGSFILLMMKERYDLVVTCGIIWIPYLAILLISHSRTYTVTPESFTVTTKLLKPRSIPLLNIIGLEKTYIRNNRPKSLVGYCREEMIEDAGSGRKKIAMSAIT